MEMALAESVAAIYQVLAPHLDERQRRMMLGAAASQLGDGGVSAVAAAAGASRKTVARGAKDAAGLPAARVRGPGAGRPSRASREPGLEEALRRLVEPDTAGDPMRPLLWTLKSTRELARALAGLGHKVSASTVARMLKAAGYSLQANVKSFDKSDHPDRDAQFRHINDRVAEFMGGGDPVVSVDAKKKELIGNYKNPGREWAPAKTPVLVNGHDFPGPDVPRALPYGVYDIAANDGWVGVGTDHDTSAFAVATIRAWWQNVGRDRYPAATRLLVCADGGGSNGSRARAWKIELAGFARDAGLDVTVCHLPPGASKWNKIEHRMFSFISMNWRGKPLVSHEVAVALIGATTTQAGLTIRCELDTRPYPTGAKHTKREVDALPIARDAFHGDWNYTINHADQDPEDDTP
jgi:transposase